VTNCIVIDEILFPATMLAYPAGGGDPFTTDLGDKDAADWFNDFLEEAKDRLSDGLPVPPTVEMISVLMGGIPAAAVGVESFDLIQNLKAKGAVYTWLQNGTEAPAWKKTVADYEVEFELGSWSANTAAGGASLLTEVDRIKLLQAGVNLFEQAKAALTGLDATAKVRDHLNATLDPDPIVIFAP
jgi:hypothetical protein